MLAANALATIPNPASTAVDDINLLLKASRYFLNFGHLNARSISSHYDELAFTIKSTSLDIIGISETWLTKKTPSALYKFPNYQCLRNDRPDRRGGGVAIYVSSNLKVRMIAKSLDHLIEFILIEITIGGGDILVGVFYIPPPVTGVIIDTLNNIILPYISDYKHVIFMGDFNVNLLMPSSNTACFLSMIDSLALTHLNFSGTRQSSLLDLALLLDCESMRVTISGQVAMPGVSDHDFIFFNYNYRCPKPVNVHKYIRDYSNINIDNLLRDAADHPWDILWSLPNCDDQVEFLSTSIINLFHKHVRLKKILCEQASTPWFNESILSSIRIRNLAYSIWIKSKNTMDLDIFRTWRNKTNLLIKNAKRKYFFSKLNPELPRTQLWHNIRNLGLIADTPDIASNFSPDSINAHFTSHIISDASLNSYQIQTSSTNVKTNSFSFIQVDASDVLLAFNMIKSNATGSDCIPLKFVKLIFPVILPYLTFVYNYCFTSSSFPKVWKHAIVIPIPKKSSPQSIADFRPISLLPFFSKIFEILIKNQIISFLDSNNFLHPYQSGFRRFHSTTTALLKVTHDISLSLKSNHFAILVLLDFSKAFDSINHTILLNKLRELFCFSLPSIKFLNSYLSGRSQCVSTGSVYSANLPLPCGVPQGSVLGPLLFSLYINNLPDQLQFCKSHLYADDFQLYYCDDLVNVNSASVKINSDLGRVSEWARANNLKLNINKTQALFINRKGTNIVSPNLVLDNVHIQYSRKVCNLGLVFNNHFDWSEHINAICRKVRLALHSLRLFRHLTPLHIRFLLAKALIIPHFIYCDVVFCNLDCASARKLQVVYNDCVRYIYALSRFDSVSRYSSNIFGCSLFEYLTFRVAIQMFKIVKMNAPDYLSSILVQGSSQRTLNLLMPVDYHKPFCDSFFFYGIVIWNGLPVEVLRSSALGGFRRAYNRRFV